MKDNRIYCAVGDVGSDVTIATPLKSAPLNACRNTSTVLALQPTAFMVCRFEQCKKHLVYLGTESPHLEGSASVIRGQITHALACYLPAINRVGGKH